jgi:3-hydroxyacyl-CoA dehydrogenase
LAQSIAIIGSGLVGRSWAYLFARAGHSVRIYDPSEECLESARSWLVGELTADVLSLIAFCPSAEEAVSSATYVQESASERLELKRDVFARITPAAPVHCIFASSTSALLPDEIFAGLATADRCLIAHPANPPHVLPIVELVAGGSTSAEVMERAAALMTSLGQDVVRVKRAAPGFILNRLQAALVEEALSLVERGIADPDDVDRTVRSGLGMRWAFVGPFETMDLNSSGGFEAYARVLGPALAASAPGGPETSNWHGRAPQVVAGARRELLEVVQIPARQRWLVEKLKSLKALKQGATETGEERA